ASEIAEIDRASRVVPRTAWPRSTSARVSARPRQPQPMIRQRANESGDSVVRRRLAAELLADLLARALRQAAGAPPRIRRLEQLVELAVGQVCLAPPLLILDVAGHAQLHVRLSDLTLPARSPSGIVRRQHLVEVVGFELLARLGDLARRTKPELLHSGARVEPAQQPHGQNHCGNAAQDHDREGVHRTAQSNPARPRLTSIGDRHTPLTQPPPTGATNLARPAARARLGPRTRSPSRRPGP